MADDDFDLLMGRIGQDRPLRHRMQVAINRAEGLHRASKSRSKFTGVRIGRGVGIGRLLAYSPRAAGRRVIVKARIVRLAGKGAAGAVAHLRYLQRDGTTRDGERGTLYGRADDAIDGKAFLERGSGDRHQFRFIVAAEDGADYDDLKSLIRGWMDQVERDLGTSLDWVAVDHFNTGHPHSHVIVRGKDDLGKDLIIARDYLIHGMRERAMALVSLQLGPRTQAEIDRANAREIEQERFTNIDRRLLAARTRDGLVSPAEHDGVEQSLRAGRLQTLGRMGLATEVSRGIWRLDADLEKTLIRMGERNDIIRTMQREMTVRLPKRSAKDYLIHASEAEAKTIVGRVVARGLSDEFADRHYLIVDGLDGHSHYIDIGIDAPPTPTGSIVRVAPVKTGPRQADRTIAEIAAANGGIYNVDLHLRHDPTATEAFAQTHVRRLEAIRRATDGVERRPDGSWIIAPDHLERVKTYEQQRAERHPVNIETLSSRSLATLPRHDGVTWLDRDMAGDHESELGRGFGADVRKAMDQRRQWLVEQDLAESDGVTVRVRRNLIALLQQRELRAVASKLSSEMAIPYTDVRKGEAVEGVYRRAVEVGDRKFALIERAQDFTLVPWRPTLERAVGKQVAGIMRDNDISWTIGRARGIGI